MEWLVGLVTLVVVIVVVWLNFRGSDDNNLGIKGKLVWTDHGRQTKPFFNRTFEVFGKPDLMYRTKNGILAVEFNRAGKVCVPGRTGGRLQSDRNSCKNGTRGALYYAATIRHRLISRDPAKSGDGEEGQTRGSSA